VLDFVGGDPEGLMQVWIMKPESGNRSITHSQLTNGNGHSSNVKEHWLCLSLRSTIEAGPEPTCDETFLQPEHSNKVVDTICKGKRGGSQRTGPVCRLGTLKKAMKALQGEEG
jgi:hypothetical protein